MRINSIVFEASILILFPFFYYGIMRALGKSRARAMLLGAVLYSLAIETMLVLSGLKNYYWYAVNNYYRRYPLGGYIIWTGLVPLAFPLMWFMICSSSMIIAESVWSRRGRFARSAISGAIAALFFLMVEPVGVTNHWWVWNAKSFYVIDLPLFYLVSTFLAVLFFVLVYRLTVVERGDFAPLDRLEEKTLRKVLIRTKKATRNLNWNQLRVVFLFRLALAYILLSAAMAPVITAFWAIANRGHIKPSW